MCPASVSDDWAVLLMNLFNKRRDLIPVVSYDPYMCQPGLSCDVHTDRSETVNEGTSLANLQVLH